MGGRLPPHPAKRRAAKGALGRVARRRPRKRFGQHFLAPTWARKVVEAIGPEAGDVFLEIGAGSGALTLPLAEAGVPILAVELDRDLIKDLAPRVPPHVTLIQGDVLRLDVVAFLRGLMPTSPPEPVDPVSPIRRPRVVGNLPYNAATAILFHLVELHRRHHFFDDASVMVQREVADRLVAKPGSKAYGALTIAAAVHTRMSRLLNLPPGAFFPRPKVHSTLIRLEFTDPTVKLADEALFHRLVRALFSQRRKMLSNALKAFDPTAPAVLALAGIDGTRRPETLQVQEIARLVELFASTNSSAML
jgi:16S rRNA (adenine1518-N6/adenine1519-N6)-dimethyltransferase